MDTNKMREQFEAYALDTFGDYHNKAEDCLTRSHDTYVYGLVHTAWQAWQASREAVVVELPDPEPLDVDCDESLEMEPEEYEALEAAHGARWSEHSRLKKAIEAQGLKVAP